MRLMYKSQMLSYTTAMNKMNLKLKNNTIYIVVWQPTPIFLPEESHGQRSLVGYSPHGVTESQTQLSRWFWFCCCLVAKSCLTFYNPMDYSPQGYSVHGISQARMLEWTAISFSRGSSWFKGWNYISCLFFIASRFFTTEPPGKPHHLHCCCSVTKSCLTLCNPMDCSTPCFSILHYLPEFAQIHAHWVGDAV